MTRRDARVRAIAAEIESHLAAHPDAADNAEGIQGWWLPAEFRERPLSDVIAALELLERRNVVVKTQLGGAGAIYSSSVRSKKRTH